MATFATVAGAIIMMVLFTIGFARALGTLREVKTEPERIDDTPWVRCPECGGVWIDDLPAIHDGDCPVAYVNKEDRRYP